MALRQCCVPQGGSSLGNRSPGNSRLVVGIGGVASVDERLQVGGQIARRRNRHRRNGYWWNWAPVASLQNVYPERPSCPDRRCRRSRFPRFSESHERRPAFRCRRFRPRRSVAVRIQHRQAPAALLKQRCRAHQIQELLVVEARFEDRIAGKPCGTEIMSVTNLPLQGRPPCRAGSSDGRRWQRRATGLLHDVCQLMRRQRKVPRSFTCSVVDVTAMRECAGAHLAVQRVCFSTDVDAHVPEVGAKLGSMKLRTESGSGEPLPLLRSRRDSNPPSIVPGASRHLLESVARLIGCRAGSAPMAG